MNAITGTFCAVESADTLAVETAGLAEVYLLALMKRDAKIWNAHYRHVVMAHDDDDGGPKVSSYHVDKGPAEQRGPTPAPKPRAAADAKLPFGRDYARDTGSNKYIREKRCHRCGGDVYYTRSAMCVACVSVDNKRRNQERRLGLR